MKCNKPDFKEEILINSDTKFIIIKDYRVDLNIAKFCIDLIDKNNDENIQTYEFIIAFIEKDRMLFEENILRYKVHEFNVIKDCMNYDDENFFLTCSLVLIDNRKDSNCNNIILFVFKLSLKTFTNNNKSKITQSTSINFFTEKLNFIVESLNNMDNCNIQQSIYNVTVENEIMLSKSELKISIQPQKAIKVIPYKSCKFSEESDSILHFTLVNLNYILIFMNFKNKSLLLLADSSNKDLNFVFEKELTTNVMNHNFKQLKLKKIEFDKSQQYFKASLITSSTIKSILYFNLIDFLSVNNEDLEFIFYEECIIIQNYLLFSTYLKSLFFDEQYVCASNNKTKSIDIYNTDDFSVKDKIELNNYWKEGNFISNSILEITRINFSSYCQIIVILLLNIKKILYCPIKTPNKIKEINFIDDLKLNSKLCDNSDLRTENDQEIIDVKILTNLTFLIVYIEFKSSKYTHLVYKFNNSEYKFLFETKINIENYNNKSEEMNFKMSEINTIFNPCIYSSVNGFYNDEIINDCFNINISKTFEISSKKFNFNENYSINNSEDYSLNIINKDHILEKVLAYNHFSFLLISKNNSQYLLVNNINLNSNESSIIYRINSGIDNSEKLKLVSDFYIVELRSNSNSKSIYQECGNFLIYFLFDSSLIKIVNLNVKNNDFIFSELGELSFDLNFMYCLTSDVIFDSINCILLSKKSYINEYECTIFLKFSLFNNSLVSTNTIVIKIILIEDLFYDSMKIISYTVKSLL